MAITPIQNVWSPKRLRASVTERRSSAPASAFSGGVYGYHSVPKRLVTETASNLGD